MPGDRKAGGEGKRGTQRGRQMERGCDWARERPGDRDTDIETKEEEVSEGRWRERGEGPGWEPGRRSERRGTPAPRPARTPGPWSLPPSPIRSHHPHPHQPPWLHGIACRRHRLFLSS